MLESHLRHGARIGQNMPAFGMRQHHRYARIQIWRFRNPAEVDPGGIEPAQRHSAKIIAAHASDETDLTAQNRKIVRRNCRRATQRDAAIASQEFAFERNLLRQTIQQDVEVNLASKGDVEARIFVHAISFRITTCERLRGESGSRPFFRPEYSPSNCPASAHAARREHSLPEGTSIIRSAAE